MLHKFDDLAETFGRIWLPAGFQPLFGFWNLISLTGAGLRNIDIGSTNEYRSHAP